MTNLKVKNILDLASGEKAPMDGRTDKAGYSRVVENSVIDKMRHLGHQGVRLGVQVLLLHLLITLRQFGRPVDRPLNGSANGLANPVTDLG